MAEQTTIQVYNNNLFSNHFLKERIQNLDGWETEVEEAFEEAKEIWKKNKELLTEGKGRDLKEIV